MENDDFSKLIKILDVIGVDYYYTEENSLRIDDLEERDFDLIDTLLLSWCKVGEFFSGVNDEYIEIPESELPENIFQGRIINE